MERQARERHAFQRVRRLKAVASTVHSAFTLARPRNRDRRAPSCSLTIPKTAMMNTGPPRPGSDPFEDWHPCLQPDLSTRVEVAPEVPLARRAVTL